MGGAYFSQQRFQINLVLLVPLFKKLRKWRVPGNKSGVWVWCTLIRPPPTKDCEESPKEKNRRSQLSEEELGSEPIPSLITSLLVRTRWNRSLSREGGMPSEPQQIRNPPEDRDMSHSAIPLVIRMTGVSIRGGNGTGRQRDISENFHFKSDDVKDHQLPTKIASFVPGETKHIFGRSREGRRQGLSYGGRVLT